MNMEPAWIAAAVSVVGMAVSVGIFVGTTRASKDTLEKFTVRVENALFGDKGLFTEVNNLKDRVAVVEAVCKERHEHLAAPSAADATSSHLFQTRLHGGGV